MECEDSVGWGEMAEGEKLVVLLGGGGARVSTFLRVILEKRRRWIGVELAGFGDFNYDCVLVSSFYNDGIVCSCVFN